MPDYSKGKIYKITTEKGCYVGCTTQTLSTRLSEHLSTLKRALSGKRNYCSSFEVIHEAREKIEIALVEAFPCESKKELLAREAEIIKDIDCINRQNSGEYFKEKSPLHQMIHDLTADYRKGKVEYMTKRLADPEYRAKVNKYSREYYHRRREEGMRRRLAP